MSNHTDDSKEEDRTKLFRRNPALEDLLERINTLLEPVEMNALARGWGDDVDYPIVFVMGPLRSGTTLFMQWLANTGLFAYPTNLLSRFYAAPVIGGLIQLLLTDPRYSFRNEILEFNSEINFNSENGKTSGALSPNEFWYFWRRFIPFHELDWLSNEELMYLVDKETLVRELTALTKVFGKPFVLKAMILNYNIAFLDALFNKALFVQMKRNPITNVASILDARKRQLGSEAAWYSFRIPEYPELKDMDPIMQAAGQIHYISRAVETGFAELPDSRKLVVEYEDFCRSPEYAYFELCQKLKIGGRPYEGPVSFNVTRALKSHYQYEIERALSFFVRRST